MLLCQNFNFLKDELHHQLAGGTLSHLLDQQLTISLPLFLPDIHEAQAGPGQWSERIVPFKFFSLCTYDGRGMFQLGQQRLLAICSKVSPLRKAAEISML